MLGRSVGLTEAQLHHLGDEVLPEGVYSPSEAAIVRYAQVSTLTITISDEIYGELEKYFDIQQIMDICFTVGLSNVVNRFHATFQTDLDELTTKVVEDGDALAGGACPIHRPTPPVSTRYTPALAY